MSSHRLACRIKLILQKVCHLDVVELHFVRKWDLHFKIELQNIAGDR